MRVDGGEDAKGRVLVSAVPIVEPAHQRIQRAGALLQQTRSIQRRAQVLVTEDLVRGGVARPAGGRAVRASLELDQSAREEVPVEEVVGGDRVGGAHHSRQPDLQGLTRRSGGRVRGHDGAAGAAGVLDRDLVGHAAPSSARSACAEGFESQQLHLVFAGEKEGRGEPKAQAGSLISSPPLHVEIKS